jgi:hypothetical protein
MMILVLKFLSSYHQSKILNLLYLSNTEGKGEAEGGGLSMSGGAIY